MIEIVEKHDNHILKFDVVCRKCGSVLRLQKDDITSDHQYNEQYCYINCPVCNTKMYNAGNKEDFIAQYATLVANKTSEEYQRLKNKGLCKNYNSDCGWVDRCGVCDDDAKSRSCYEVYE